MPNWQRMDASGEHGNRATAGAGLIKLALMLWALVLGETLIHVPKENQ
jgi:hypothetical protein